MSDVLRSSSGAGGDRGGRGASGGAGQVLVPYLVGQLSQPVRLQQQRRRRVETKPMMRYVGGVMVK